MEIKTISNFKESLNGKKVTGYIWMIDDKAPKIYIAESEKAVIYFEKLYTKKKPYNKIQEAYLFHDNTSYHVKNIDGEELCFINKLDDFKDPNGKEKYKIIDLVFPSHIQGIDYLKFNQVYELMTSISGEGFKTWQPIVRLFQGFIKPINQQNTN